MAPAIATYEPRDPSSTVLYKVIADHLETFLASCEADPDAKGLPAYVERELYDYLQCGVLAHGFLRLGCDTCQHEMLLAFSCKRNGGGFARRVPGGAWPRPRPTWSSRSFPGSPPANGSSRCPSLCGIGWPLHRTSPLRSIRSFAPRSGSIMCTKPSHEASREPTSKRGRSHLS